jgi:phospholipid/cholesterol/gamma-HCH transport system substrate-binding protein
MAAGRASAASAEFEAVLAGAREATANVTSFSEGLNRTLTEVNALVAAVDRDRIAGIVQDAGDLTSRLSAAAVEVEEVVSGAQSTVEDIRSFAASLEARQTDIGSVIDNARDISDRLNAASQRIDGILANAETLLAEDGGGFIAEANAAAQSLRRMADTFEARADEISSGLVRFSEGGLGNLNSLINDARATLAQFERLAAEPNQILFGGGADVREYNRR